MGAVLEMTMARPIAALLMFAGLAACGEQGATGLLSRATQLVVNQMTDEAPAPRAAASVSEEEILGNPGKYVRVNIRNFGIWDTLVVAGTNGARTTWIGGTGASVTTESGVVVATRGLPRDLMGAEAGETSVALRNGGGTYVRVHDFLTDQDQSLQFALTCTLEGKGGDQVNRLGQSLPAQRFEEVCRSENLTLTNVYWVDGGGKIIRSLQAVSPDAGYLQIDVF